jgi:hypothetical protein
MGSLHEDLCVFMIISCWVLLRMRNVSEKFCRRKMKTQILCSINSFRKSCRLWVNVEENVGRTGQATDIIIRCMCFACWIPKDTNTGSEHVTFIFHCNNGCTNAFRCCAIHQMPVLFFFVCTGTALSQQLSSCRV